MIIKDLFSHKIHSSANDWPDKLIDIASIFSEFDSQVYDRKKLRKDFQKLVPAYQRLLVIHQNSEMK